MDPLWFADFKVLCANSVTDLHRLRLFTCIRMRLVYYFPGVPLGLIPGTSECMQMLPRLVRGIYRMQVNCKTDLGICCPPFSLVVSRRYPEGQPVACVFRVAVSQS